MLTQHYETKQTILFESACFVVLICMSSKSEHAEKTPSNLKRMLKEANIQAPHVEAKLQERATKQMETYLQIILIRMHEQQIITQQRNILQHNLNVLHVMKEQTESDALNEK